MADDDSKNTSKSSDIEKAAAKVVDIASLAEEEMSRQRAERAAIKMAGPLGTKSAIEEALRNIERAKTRPKIYHTMTPPPNPRNTGGETVDLLTRIEEQFGRTAEIAEESARVAQALHGYAEIFLDKFTVEARSNAESVERAITVAKWSLGGLALSIIISLAAPYVMPDLTADALQQSVVDLREEVTTLREDQAAASDRLIEVLSQSDRETATALRAIAEQLARPDLEPPATLPTGPIERGGE